VIYKVSAPYSPDHDRNIRFDDPDLAVNWPVLDGSPVLSEKDLRAPAFAAVNSGFNYGEEGN
jgi:dTDP-4-dehydrorhamnose 3,5-epimerase